MTARPPIPAPPLKGGCLCGAARYRLTVRPLAINACHCTDCKRLSGVDAAVLLHLPREAVVLDEGATARFRKTADSGREIDIVRCAACGTRLWHEPLSVATLTFVAAGTLDDAAWAVPTSHIWAERGNGAMPPAADALVIEGPPADRQALWDRFARLYPASA